MPVQGFRDRRNDRGIECRRPSQIAFPLLTHPSRQMARPSLAMHDLASAGHAKSLFRSLVSLLFGHGLGIPVLTASSDKPRSLSVSLESFQATSGDFWISLQLAGQLAPSQVDGRACKLSLINNLQHRPRAEPPSQSAPVATRQLPRPRPRPDPLVPAPASDYHFEAGGSFKAGESVPTINRPVSTSTPGPPYATSARARPARCVPQ